MGPVPVPTLSPALSQLDARLAIARTFSLMLKRRGKIPSLYTTVDFTIRNKHPEFDPFGVDLESTLRKSREASI
jgi:hypothetical protein